MTFKFTRQGARFTFAAILTLLSGLAHAAAQSGWVSTATKAVNPAKASLIGAIPANMPLNIAVSVRPRDPAQLKAFATQVNTPGSPVYGRFLSGNQFLNQYAPTQAQAQAVADYLKGAGFRNVKISANRLMVSGSASAATVQSAFNTSLSLFKQNGKPVYFNTRDAQVPVKLSGIATAVLGLSNLRMHNFIGVPKRPPLMLLEKGISPQAFQKAYGAVGTMPGSDTTIAIFASGDVNPAVVDLRAYENDWGLPQVPVQIINVGTGPWTGVDGLGEWDLDVASSTGMAGNVAKLIIYAASENTLLDTVDSFNQFVTDNVAKAGSASFGICDIFAAISGLNTASDPIYAQAAAQGQTVFAADGDVGPSCPVVIGGAPIGQNGVADSGVPLQQSYPASAPFVVAVGGTTLTLNSDDSYDFEAAWNAGGGGPSTLEPAPSWQANVVTGGSLQNADPLGAISLVNESWGQQILAIGKAVPDIAMNADFILAAGAVNDNCTSGTDPNCWSSNGGTSLASPLALGAWARVLSASNNCYGFAAPLFYAMSPGQLKPTPGFNDVILGTNGGYVATPGWDFTTGLGSINVGALITALPLPPASCGSSSGNHSPVAQLHIDRTSGAAPLSVNVNALGSSDPDAGDSLASASIDFGDGSPVLAFAPAASLSHIYNNPGVYTASLTVTDSHGASSVPATTTVTVDAPHAANAAACKLPGATMLSDAQGDGLVPLPGFDLGSFTLAEPVAATDADIKLVFTLKTDAGQSPQPPGTAWYVSMLVPDGTVRAVRMSWNGTTPKFESYVATSSDSTTGPGVSDGRFPDTATLKPIDPSSSYDPASGKITLVVKASDLSLHAGDYVGGFNAASTVSSDPLALGIGGITETVDMMPDDLVHAGGFLVYGSAFCAGVTPGSVPVVPASGARVSLSPSALDFGSQYKGRVTPAKTVVLSNTGSKAFSIYSIGTGSSSFDVTNSCASTLSPNQRCYIRVVFKPASIGAITGNINILTNAGTALDRVSLTGTGK